MKAQQMLTGRGLHWLLQQVRGGSFRVDSYLAWQPAHLIAHTRTHLQGAITMLDIKRRARRENGIKETSNQLFVLPAYVFVVMIGFGITLPVLPFYVERLALAGGASRQSIVLHVGLLTGIYPLVQLIFAPLWGRWSDRIGRRPLVLIGIAGYVIAQVLFGLATSLWLLYARPDSLVMKEATTTKESDLGADPLLRTAPLC